MDSASPMSYAWFVEEYRRDSDLIGVTFVRGLSPEGALRRIGATPGDISREVGIAAYAADGGAVLIDYHCWATPREPLPGYGDGAGRHRRHHRRALRLLRRRSGDHELRAVLPWRSRGQ
ncbi:hypothetical protein GCM10020220_108620 [Nonomuraea rubra]